MLKSRCVVKYRRNQWKNTATTPISRFHQQQRSAGLGGAKSGKFQCDNKKCRRKLNSLYKTRIKRTHVPVATWIHASIDIRNLNRKHPHPYHPTETHNSTFGTPPHAPFHPLNYFFIFPLKSPTFHYFLLE